MKRKYVSDHNQQLDSVKKETVSKQLQIKDLSPYLKRWTVKVRVTTKGPLRTYANARGSGKLFSFDVLDSECGELHVTCFNDVADKFYADIEVDNVYLISNGMLKPASKTFNHLQNEYELHLEKYSRVEQCPEDDACIPKHHFKFIPIGEIQTLPPNSFVDIIGVVSSINATKPIEKKDGTRTQKRSVWLKDKSGFNVELTLWGKSCEEEGQQINQMVDSGVFPVLSVKGGRICDFNGKSVGTVPSTQLFLDPELPEARELRHWIATIGSNTTSVSVSKYFLGTLSSRRTHISQIKDDQLGTSNKPDFITVIATISSVKTENFAYNACPLMDGARQCNKKVIMNDDCQWHCTKCDKTFEECNFRYILQLKLQDRSGATYVTAFQEAGEEVMGISAENLYNLKEDDEEKFNHVINSVISKHYIFNLKVKEETYNYTKYLKVVVMKAEKLNYATESKILLDLMDAFVAEKKSTE